MAYYLISADFTDYQAETPIEWKGATYYYNTEDPDLNPAFSELGMGLNVASGDEVTVLAGEYEVIMSSGWYTNSGTITISNVKYDADHAATEDDIYAATSVDIEATLKNNGTLIVQSGDPNADLEFTITKLTNAGTVEIGGTVFDAGTFTNNDTVSIANTEFYAESVINGENKSFTLENSTFTALNTIVNDGTFYVTSSEVDADFDGGEISLTGTFGDATDITGAAEITATSVILNGDASVEASKLTVAGDGIDLNGTASLFADEVVVNSRIYANGVNKLDLSNISGSAIISARTGAELADSYVDRTVFFSNNTKISGDSYIKTVSIKGTSIDPASSGYRSLTITGDFASEKIDTGTSAGTKPNSAFITFTDADADLGTLAVTGQSVITVKNSTVGADVVNLSGVINVEGESSLVFGKVSPNTTYGPSTINAGGATLSDTSIAKTSATFAVATATNLTLQGANSILANIDNQGIITLASEGTGDEFEAAFLEGSVSTGNIVIANGAVVLDNDPETAAPKSAQLIKGTVSAEITNNNAGYNNFKDSTGYYLTVENRNTLFVNPAYQIVDGSAVMSDGHILGYNAFNSFTAAMQTAALYPEVNAISLADDITAESNARITLPFSKDLTISGPNTATINFSGNNDLIITVTEDNKITLAEGTTLKTTGADGYIVLGGAGSYDVQGTVDSVSQVAFWTDATVSGEVVSEYTGANTGMVLFRSAYQGSGDGVVINGGSVDTGRAFLVSGKLTTTDADFNATVLEFTQNLDEASATPWWAEEVVNENGEALLGAKFVLNSTDSVWTIGSIDAASANAKIDGEFTFTGDEVNVSGNANLGDKITLKLIDSDMSVDGTLTNAGTITLGASGSPATLSAGKLENSGTIDVLWGSSLAADELVNDDENGAISVRGANNSLDITDLDGTIKIETAGGNTTLLGSQIGDKDKNGIVEINTADSGKGVYFKGESSVAATINNNGRMYVGASTGDGFLTAGIIENNNGAALTIRSGSELIGATINNNANNTITVDGTLNGVTVQGGSIDTTNGFTFAGASKLEGVTINKSTATLTVNGTLTVDTASAITVNEIEFATGGSITVTAESTLADPRVIFTFADSPEGRANAAALMTKIKNEGVFVAQRGNLIYAAKATPETQDTILVNNTWAADPWGTPYGFDEDTYYNGINAFGSLSDLTYNHAKDGAFVEDATVVTASTIILKNGDTYAYTTPAFLFADNEEGVTLQGETGVATSVSITGNKSFYLMGAVDVENEADYAAAITEAAKNAQKFTIANGLTVNVSDLRVGMPVNYDDFDPEFDPNDPTTATGAPKRQASVADLTISGTVVLPKVDGRLVAAPLSKISVTADGKVVIPDEAVINAGASLSVTGNETVKAAMTEGENPVPVYQYAGGSLHIIDGAAVTFKDTKASLSYGYNMYYGYSHNNEDNYSSFTNKAFINVDGWGDLATYKPADNTITLTFDNTILDVVAGDYGMAESFFVFNKASVDGDMAKLPAVVLNVKNGSVFNASAAALNLEEGSDVTVNVDESSLSVDSVVSYGEINLTGKKVGQLITTASLEAAVIDNDGTIDADYATITADEISNAGTIDAKYATITAGEISNAGTFKANNSTITVAAEAMEDPSDYTFSNEGTATAQISNSTLTAGYLKGAFTLTNDDVTAQIVAGTLDVTGANTLALGTKVDAETQTGDMSGATILLNLGAEVSGSIYAADTDADFEGGTIETADKALIATIGDLDAAKTKLVNEDGKALDIKGAATFADVVNGSTNAINIVSTAATQTAPAIDASLTAHAIDNAGRINVGSVNEVAASLTGTTITNSGIVNVYKNSTVEVTAGILNDGGDTQAQFNLKAGSTIIGANGVYMNLGNGKFEVTGASVSKLGINTAYDGAPSDKAEIVITDSVIDLGTGNGTSVINATKANKFTIGGESKFVGRINGAVTLLDDTTLTDSTIIKYGSGTATIKVAEDSDVTFDGANTVSTFVNAGDVIVAADGSLTTGALSNTGTITVNGTSLKAASISAVGTINLGAAATLTVTGAITGTAADAINLTVAGSYVAGTTLISAGSGLLSTVIYNGKDKITNGSVITVGEKKFTAILNDKSLTLTEGAQDKTTLYVNEKYTTAAAAAADGHAFGINAFAYFTSAVNAMDGTTTKIEVASSKVATAAVTDYLVVDAVEIKAAGGLTEAPEVTINFSGADFGLKLTPGVVIDGVNITTTAANGDAWTGSVYVNHAAAAGTVTIDGDITAAGHIYFCGSAEVTGDLATTGDDSQILFRAGKAADGLVTIDGSAITGNWIVMVSGKTEIKNSTVSIGSFGYDNYADTDAAPIFGSTNSNWTIGELDLVHKQTPGTTRVAATINLDNSEVKVTGKTNSNSEAPEVTEAAEIGEAITINLVKASTISVAEGTLKNDGSILSDTTATVISAKEIYNGEDAKLVSANINAGVEGVTNYGFISAGTIDSEGAIWNEGEITVGEEGSITATHSLVLDGSTASIIAGTINVFKKTDLENSKGNLTNDGRIEAGSIVAGGTIGNVGTIEAGSVSATYIENSGTFTASGEENVVSGKFNNMAGGSVTLKDGVSLGTADAKISLIGNSKNAAKFEVLNASVYATQLQNLADFTVEGTTATATFNVGTVRNTSTLTFKGNVALTINTIATGTGYKGITLDGANLFDASVGGAYTTTVATDSAFNGKSSFSSLTVADDVELTINANAADCLTVTGDLNSTGSIFLSVGDDLFTETNLVRVITVGGDFNVGPITTEEGYSVIVQDKDVYLLNGAPTSMATIVLDITWGNAVPIGEPVNFGGNEYTYGVDAFTWAPQLVNLTTETTLIKFRTSEDTYGDLNLARANVSGSTAVAPLKVVVTRVDGTGVGTEATFDDTKISTDVNFDVQHITFADLTISGSTVNFDQIDTKSVTAEDLLIKDGSEVDFEGSVEIVGGATITNSRVNFGEEDKEALTTISGNVTITDADVDFDDVTKIGVEGSEEPVLVKIEGVSEVEFDRNTTIYGSLTLEAGSVIEANQGYEFTVGSAEINGELLVGDEDKTDALHTSADLGTLTGSGNIYTDINSELTFSGAGFTGKTYINVSGLTAGNKQFQTIVADEEAAAATFVVTGTGVVDGTSFQKYFTYDENGLTQIGRAANVYEATVGSQTAIYDAVTGTGWNATGGADDPDYFVDNVTLTGNGEFAEGVAVYLGVNDDQTVILDGKFNVGVYGGTIYGSTTSRAGVNLGGDITVTVNSGSTFDKVLVGGDRINVGSGRAIYYRENEDGLASINLTIDGGTFKNYVATGILYQGENLQGSVEVGSTNLKINGGTFAKDVYGGNYGNRKASSSCTFVESSNVTLTVGGAEKINMAGCLFVGSFGSGKVETTHLTLAGQSDAADALVVKEIWGGCGSDYNKDVEGGTTYETAVSGSRTLSFTGFQAAINSRLVSGFSAVEVLSNGEELLDEDRFDTNATLQDTVKLSDVENWTFEAGSTLNGAFINDFAGDSLTLIGISEYFEATELNSWTLFGDTTNFAGFDSFKSVDFGGTAEVEFDGTSWSDGTYALSINENKQMVLGLA